jgi:hypothetical protein
LYYLVDGGSVWTIETPSCLTRAKTSEETAAKSSDSETRFFVTEVLLKASANRLVILLI